MFGLLRTTIISLALAFGAGAALAQDFDKGLAAYNAGDYATALKEWRPLAEQGDGIFVQGDVEAQSYLGFMYHNGTGVLQDYAEAVKFYRSAAEQGNDFAQFKLGFMYEKGKGVLQNNVMAHVWYNIAAANGAEKAGEWREKTAAKMTSADISKAQSMARECMSSNYKNCGW